MTYGRHNPATERDAEIERLYLAGLYQHEIGARFGISRVRVSQILLKPPPEPRQRPTKHPQYDRIATLLERGMTQGEAARVVGLSRKTVNGILRKAKTANETPAHRC